jgi:hypothetical protein
MPIGSVIGGIEVSAGVGDEEGSVWCIFVMVEGKEAFGWEKLFPGVPLVA